MIVFCGSSVSGMRSETEDKSSPLHGRILSRRTIGPLTFRECMGFHPGMDELDRLRLYLTVGGVPLYHMMMQEGTYRECMAAHFMGDGADLRDEAENILTCELSPKENYIAVVEAVAGGCATIDRIVTGTGIPRTSVVRYLENLEELGIVDTVTPMSMKGSTAPPIGIRDDIVAFGYEIIGRFEELKSFRDPLGSYDVVYDDIVSFLGERFERFCSEYVRDNYLTLRIGRWWGRFEGEDTDIDIVARVSDGRSRYDLYCECKFRRRETAYRDYRNLKDKVTALNSGRDVNERFMIFSASGFSDSLMEAEEDEPRLILVDLDMLVGRKPAKPL